MKIIKELKIGEGINIIQREGKDLVLSKDGGYKTTFTDKKEKEHRKNIWNATMDWCFDSVKMNEIKTDKDMSKPFYMIDGKQYSDAIMSVKFKCAIKESEEINEFNEQILELNKRNKEIELRLVEIRSQGVSLRQCKYKGEYKTNLTPEQQIYVELYEEQQSITEEKRKKIKELKNQKKNDMQNTEQIRKELYKNGFDIIDSQGKKSHMVRYKRSSGSSRVGKCLFIREDLYKPMMDWTMMDLYIKDGDEIDLASYEAYISLTLSSMIDTINIKPENILILKDEESKIREECMVTEQIIDKSEKAILCTTKKYTDVINKIWDGESLLDSSLFKEKYEDKGMLLLRNQLIKTCAFNTEIQKYYKDHNITIKDIKNSKYYLYTKAKKVEDILLITTPSSLKYCKFGSIENYLNNMDEKWGIVKYDKPTHYFDGELVQTHYQLLNSLNCNKKDISDILKQTKEYVGLLKNDMAVLRRHLKMQIEQNEESKLSDEEIMNREIEGFYNEDYLNINKDNHTKDMMYTLLTLNDKIKFTTEFINFQKDVIRAYKDNARLGHILIHGNYSVLCGNGIEMLKGSCNKWNIEEGSIIKKGTIYCNGFKEVKLIGSRSPHPSPSCIFISKNTIYDEIDTYFNSSKQIVHINSIKENNLEKLSSADYDSDQMLLSDNEKLIEIAERHYEDYPVSVNCVVGKKTPRYYTNEDKCDLDVKTSKNFIGQIINQAQILESYLNDLRFKMKKEKYINEKQKLQQQIDDVFIDISTLNIMSCIEIDKAKKEFDIDNESELNKLKEKYDYIKLPNFFKYTAKKTYQDKKNKIKEKILKNTPYEKIDKVNDADDIILIKKEKNKVIKESIDKAISYMEKEKYQHYETTMDYLETEIDKFTYNRKTDRRVDNKDNITTIIHLLTNKYKEMLNHISDADRKQIVKVMGLIIDSDKKTRALWCNINLTGEDKYFKTIQYRVELINKLSTFKIKFVTLISTLKQIKEGKYSNIGRIALSVLYSSHREMFLEMFRIQQEEIEILCEGEDIELYGMNFGKKKTTRDI
jgi:hypothetical protein